MQKNAGENVITQPFCRLVSSLLSGCVFFFSFVYGHTRLDFLDVMVFNYVSEEVTSIFFNFLSPILN